MAFNWSEYLEVARKLAGIASMPHSDEANYRAAISRAYYAAFCTAVDYLIIDDPALAVVLKPTGRFGPIGVHKRVLDELEPRDSSIRRKLRKLFKNRIVADYENPPTSLSSPTPNFRALAENSCNNSSIIIDDISKL